MAKTGTILIIDDDEDLLEVEGAMLENAGFTILSTDSVDDGLNIVETNHPDVVLLDLVFPEDPDFGHKAAHRLKSMHPNLPVFLLTSIHRNHLTGIEEGDTDFDAILTKPVNFESLARLLEKYVDSSGY